MLKKAIFVNTEHIVDMPALMNKLEEYKGIYDVFLADQANLQMKSLCTGVQASYLDYDYVVCINPVEKEINDIPRNYAAKQYYHMMGLLAGPEKTDAMIARMEADPVWGMAMLPTDYLTSSNWDQYESWADYYKIMTKWMRRNKIKVPTNIDRPPVCAIGGCSIIRTAAIKNLDSFVITMFGPFFMAIMLALVCQHNGYLPQYVITKELLVNNFFGYETYTSWIPDVLKVKQEYYKQLTEYNKQTADYYKQVEEQMDIMRESLVATQQENEKLRQACEAHYQENQELRQICDAHQQDNEVLRQTCEALQKPFLAKVKQFLFE